MIFIFIFTNIQSNNDIPLSQIKDSIAVFLKKNGDWPPNFTVENLPNSVIINMGSKKCIEEHNEGIFLIPNFSTHGYAHYLLIDSTNFIIINMKERLNKNMKTFVDFLRKNYNIYKNDILFYISDMINTFNRNESRLNSSMSIIINEE